MRLSTVFVAIAVVAVPAIYAFPGESGIGTAAQADEHALMVQGSPGRSYTEDTLQSQCGGPAVIPDGCAIQFDGGEHGDASDVCANPDPQLEIDEMTSGLLTPKDDPEDDYALLVAPWDPILEDAPVFIVTLQPSPVMAKLQDEGLLEVYLDAWGPGCEMPLGSGHPTAAGNLKVVFEAKEPGTQTIQIRAVLTEPPTPGTKTCHYTCVGLVNAMTGYDLGTYQVN
ncbi:MAG: hypothetical protein HY556_08075 [Euryarchaeota archaeon]|nr:hypothetical protein [Euryarchaeota archaeon]